MNRFTEHRQSIRELASTPITPSVILSLRKQVDEETARELLAIASLQVKARQKFGDGIWMATARALEQASDQAVATYKASLMSDRVVVDLCGGIGGDAMAFARRGSVVTVDCDPQMTRMAAENLQAIQATHAAAVCADATSYVSRESVSARHVGLHVDPDRRPHGRRTTAPDEYQPSLTVLSDMVSAAGASLIKLAPAADLDQVTSSEHHRQWISFAGSVREQSVLGGDCMSVAGVAPGTRSAVRLMKDGSRQMFAAALSTVAMPGVAAVLSPLKYILDLDPAIRAAGLSSAFAETLGLQCLGDASGFFTSDQLPGDSALVQPFECLWSGPADRKLIRKQLAALGLRLQVAKVRGTDHDPPSLIRALNRSPLDDRRPATLLLGRHRDAVYAVLGKPC